MSLINDALKKTQRMRSDPNDSGSVVAGGGGGHAGPRGRGNSGPSMGLLIGGGLLLMAVAVVGTILLLKSKSAPTSAVTPTPAVALSPVATPPPVAAASSLTSNVPAASGPAPLIVLPKIDAIPTRVAAAAAPAPTTVAATKTAPELTAAPTSAPAAPAKPKVEVATFIDAIHVTGVRFSEGSSKVLMNDHVYKVNDIVERVLNIKLTEVGTDSLTFVDENGAVYKKNF